MFPIEANQAATENSIDLVIKLRSLSFTYQPLVIRLLFASNTKLMKKCEFGLVRAKDLKENGSEAERGEVMSTLTHTHTCWTICRAKRHIILMCISTRRMHLVSISKWPYNVHDDFVCFVGQIAITMITFAVGMQHASIFHSAFFPPVGEYTK